MLIRWRKLGAHLPWVAVCLLATVLSAAWYAQAARLAERWPGGSSRVGLVLGTAAAVILIFEFLLWPRKKVRAWRIGRAQTWLRAHIWLGLLSVPLVVLHSGFALGGELTTVLMCVFALVILSGVVGLVLQNMVPAMMLEQVPAETIYAQIDHVMAQAVADARRQLEWLGGGRAESARDGDRPATPSDPGESPEDPRGGVMVIGAVRNRGSFRGKVFQTEVASAARVENIEVLRGGFDQVIEPYLLQGRRGESLLARRQDAQRWFASLRARVEPAAARAVDHLEELCEQRRQLDTQVVLHHLLHGWTLVHLPLSILLMGLLVVHIVTAVKYW